METLSTTIARWLEAFPELERLCEAGEAEAAATRGLAATLGHYQQTARLAGELRNTVRSLAETDQQTAARQSATAFWFVCCGIALAAIVGLSVLLITRSLNRHLRQITSEIAESAEQVTGAATQVSASSQVLAQGASEQAATLEETSASSEELTSMTRKNSEHTQAAASVVNSVDQRVQEANQALDVMVVSMREINESSDKVSRIIKVINEIAFQTNILALNAAVEAARAGEAGMGFAVVADEVRNLAQRSAQAAEDTAQLIEESISRSGVGKRKLEEVAAAIQGITAGAVEVKTLIEEVSVGSQEQARGIEQVSRAVVQMEQVTQNTAATAEESASASEELSAMAEAMRRSVSQLEALVGSGAGGHARVSRRAQTSTGATVAAPPVK
jgi:methyl-accepting chemotaxis protein/methyl-accepting chemotaxis protein-1 (serine sensor receptor)